MSQDLPPASESSSSEPELSELSSSEPELSESSSSEPSSEPELSELSSSEPELSESEAASPPTVAPSSEPVSPAVSVSDEAITTPVESIEAIAPLTDPSSSVVTEPPLPSSIVSPPSTIEELEPPLASSTVSPPSAIEARSPAKAPPVNDEILPQTLLRLLGEAVVAAQPGVKKQSIKALRGTIHLLEGVVERLEAEPAPKPMTSKATAPETPPENVLSPDPASGTGRLASPSQTDEWQMKLRRSWQQVQQVWRSLLRQIRDRLPTAIKRRISDQALTAAIVSSVVILLWSTAALLPDQPQPTTVATPPTTNATPTPVPTPVQTPIPPVVKAPDPPKPVEISPSPVKPSPPPPPLKMTPEQTLIARIQDQVAAISNQYVSGLIQSVQANFRSSRLIVSVSDGWYGLPRSQQDKLAGELLRRTQALDFIKLELVNSEGTLLARSPVVGSEMVILQRTNTPNQVE